MGQKLVSQDLLCYYWEQDWIHWFHLYDAQWLYTSAGVLTWLAV